MPLSKIHNTLTSDHILLDGTDSTGANANSSVLLDSSAANTDVGSLMSYEAGADDASVALTPSNFTLNTLSVSGDNTPLEITRPTDEGKFVEFFREGSDGPSSKGDIHFNSNDLFAMESTDMLSLIQNNTTKRSLILASTFFKPFNSDDDTLDLGSASARWDDVYATNGTIQTSDKNEKNTIVDSDLGLDFIKKLTPKSYKFNDKTRTHYGLIAQDVETVLSDISKSSTDFAGIIKTDISENKDGSSYRYGLRYTELISPMIKALQEANEKIEALEAKVAKLEEG